MGRAWVALGSLTDLFNFFEKKESMKTAESEVSRKVLL